MDEFTRTLLSPAPPRTGWFLPLDDRLKGIAYMLAASALFALMFALPKIAGGQLSGLQAAFVRYATGFATILPVALWAARRGVPLATDAMRLIGLRAAYGVGGVACIVFATTHMAYADALAISFADGVFILLLAGLALGERVSARRWMAAAVCLAGAVIVAQPSPELLGRVWMEPAAGVAFLGAFVMAGEVVAIKHLTHRVAAPTLLLYTNAIAVTLAAVPAFLAGGWPGPETLTIYGLMGPVAILGQFLFMTGVRCADVSALVPYKYSTIVFGGLLGIVLFGQWPDALTCVGAAMIIAAGVQLTRLESRRAPTVKETP